MEIAGSLERKREILRRLACGLDGFWGGSEVLRKLIEVLQKLVEALQKLVGALRKLV